MEGIPTVTALKEPNFEGNISQLGGRHFPHINCGKQLIINHKTSSMHSKHPCTQYSKETSLSIIIIFNLTRSGVILTVMFPIVQFVMLPNTQTILSAVTVLALGPIVVQLAFQ